MTETRQVLLKNWPGGKEAPIYEHLYISYIGMCCCEGYGFQAVYFGIGYRNQRGCNTNNNTKLI